jgi:hypothetical protein
VHETVRAGVVHTEAPVPLDHAANFGSGVSVAIVKRATIQAKATRPGEISGPASMFTLQFTNRSSHVVSLSNVVVNDTDSRGTPLVAIAGSPSNPVHGRLAPNRSAQGSYVFELSGTRNNPYTISVSYSTAAPVVLFLGNAA